LKKNLKQKSDLLKTAYNTTIHLFLERISFGLYYRPERVQINFTLRCNLKCKHCLVPHYFSDELSLKRWKEIMLRLRKWLGCFFLVITGGEPLLREDVVDLIKFSNSLGITTCLITNGTLIDKYMADRLVESGLNIICISLDGFKEKTHNFLRGDGVYKKTMEAIEYLKNRSILQICTTVLSCNLEELLELVNFVEDNRIAINFQGWKVKNIIGDFDIQNHALWPKDREKVERIFNELILRKEKNHSIINSIRHLQLMKSYYINYHLSYHCQAYKRNFNIDPNGVVGLCYKFRPIGNATWESPNTMWNSKETSLIRKKMKGCNFNCSFLNCHFYESFLEKVLRFKNIYFNF